MPALAAREARGLANATGLREVRGALFLGAALLAAGCSLERPASRPDQVALTALRARAERLDRDRGTSVYAWLANHEPSRLDVARGSLASAAAFDRGAVVRAAGIDLRRACRLAKRDRALLLAFVPATSSDRALALDCGFALERDPAAVVVAPR